MTLTDVDIARWRLRTQHLVEPYVASTDDVLRGLLAVQAEQPLPTSWAIASRTDQRDPTDLAGLLDTGAVLRTHVLRPTWHYVRADDVVWLLELTAPRVQRVSSTQLRVVHGLDGAELERAVSAVAAAVEACGHPTRPRLAAELAARGLPVTGQALMLLLVHTELAGHICSGPPAEGEHTYALLADRVPAPRRLDRDEALAEIALRYATGHGPVTERDLAYWATLPLGEVRRGLAAAGAQLATFEHDGRMFWHAPDAEPPMRGRPGAHLLSLFDECYRGYQDSRWMLDAAGQLSRAREASTSIALCDGQAAAHMRRTVTATTIRFELRPYRPFRATEERELKRAARAQGTFFGRTAEVAVVA